MVCIFIDSNIYLRFFADERVTQLAEPLASIRGRVLVTTQIVDEVKRNKVKKLVDFLNATERSVPRKLSLPEHLLAKDSQQKELAARRDEHYSAAQRLIKDIEARSAALVVATSKGEDHVSKTLASFFGKAIEHTPQQQQRAERRRLHGNPPGKPGDPLGDQLNWVMFVDAAEFEPHVWIITGDGDFLTRYKDSLVLNAFLYDELQERGVGKIHCFDTLAQALPHIQKTLNTQMKALPNKTGLSEVAIAERLINSIDAVSSRPDGLTYGMTTDKCPRCGGEMSGVGLFGGSTWKQRCLRCGLLWDTTEDIED